MVVKADNVLTPKVIQALYRHHKDIEKIKTKYGETWADVCVKLPIVKAPDLTKLLLGKRRKRQDETTSRPDENRFDLDSFTFEGGLFEEEDDIFNEEGEDYDFFNNYDDVEPVEPVEPELQPKKKSKMEERLDMGEYFSVTSYPQPYCGIVEDMEKACMSFSILELWANNGKYDEKTDADIEALTTDAILDKINNVNKSGVFQIERDFAKLLSRIKRDEDGRIVSAEATVLRWFSKMNITEVKENPAVDRGEPVDDKTLKFESAMLDVLLNTSHYPEGMESYPNVQRSFGDIAGETILGDVKSLVVGYMILTLYVQIMLGKFNCVENRSILTIAGISGVILGIVVSFGLCSILGLFFGPMHSVLPFLLLGIGIDDMFVIVQCWDTLQLKMKKDDMSTLPERFGKTMSQAGGAITITSATDIIAFAIGGTTVLPALQSFCLYASVGIVAIYFFQCTFFVAWMVLDQRRIENSRNACLPCYKHSDWTPNALSHKDISRTIFKAYGLLITKPFMKTIIILGTLALTGVSIWGNVLIEQKFDPAWFLPPDTYMFKWFQMNKEYFPFGGARVTVHAAGIDPSKDLRGLYDFTLKIEDATDIVDNVDSWATGFVDYYNRNFASVEKLPEKVLDHDEFAEKFTQFLFSPRGSRYRERFIFEKPLTCGEPASKLLLSEITFQHKFFSGPSEHVPAMNRIKTYIKEANFTGRVFAISRAYAAWETDEVISHELYRNIGLAFICVFFTTMFLITNVATSIIVLLCVLLSLVDVGGFMHFWGLTIDTVSCVNLIIAIGLCVDYSAHIAHRFMTETGSSKNRRVVASLSNIGPAVLNGGISTFLAFILLAGSKSHVFLSFFKIFFLVVTFGLFHGLVVLPVILSLIGPSSHFLDSATPTESEAADAPNNTTRKEST